MLKRVFLIFAVCLYFVNPISASYECEHKEVKKMIENFEAYKYTSFTNLRLNEMHKLRESLDKKERVCIKEFLLENYRKPNQIITCSEIVVFFAFVKDVDFIEVIKKTYLLSKNDNYISACEAYFVNVNYNSKHYFKRIAKRLELSKQEEYYILYAASAIRDSRIAEILLVKNINYGYGEAYGGEGSEYWLGAMSWVERNEKWMSEESDEYRKERLDLIRKERNYKFNNE
ncbi:MAG: hypothetical protein JXR81_06900 [Candidatus Goldbacteria bacterium]|nr:hypothetical protein [Candidatus Goldiibacteriota bacterium]